METLFQEGDRRMTGSEISTDVQCTSKRLNFLSDLTELNIFEKNKTVKMSKFYYLL